MKPLKQLVNDLKDLTPSEVFGLFMLGPSVLMIIGLLIKKVVL
jgi:Na+-transporting NADH:ubiquinone oxidoreductase subunit NqrD